MLERAEEGEEEKKHGRASDSFLHGTENKRVDWLKGQDAGRKSGGGCYKNVKRALQPFSWRSVGGH